MIGCNVCPVADLGIVLGALDYTCLVGIEAREGKDGRRRNRLLDQHTAGFGVRRRLLRYGSQQMTWRWVRHRPDSPTVGCPINVEKPNGFAHRRLIERC